MRDSDSSSQVHLNGRIFLRSDGSLSIERAVAEDAGTYVCTAVNIAGSRNVTASVEIHGKTHGYMEFITSESSTLGISYFPQFLKAFHT